MVWYDYLPQIVAGVITLWVLKISYFFIKRRYTQSSVVYKNSTEESDVYGSSENVFNESSPESLNLDQEKKMVDINNVTRCSGYGSTEDEMLESKNYTTTQDVSDTCIFNSDSHSSIMSWESCHEGISHSELDFVNHPEICKPLNLCMRDKKNETGTNKICKTFFTDRKHKSIKVIQKKTPEEYLEKKIIEDYDRHTLNNDNLDNTEHELKHENNLEITKLSSTYQGELEDEYNLDNTEYELKNKNKLELTKISSIHHDELKDEYSLDNTEHELRRDAHNLEITELSSTYQDELEYEYSLDNTEYELKNKNKLEITNISSIHHDELKDEYSLDNTEHELRRDARNLEITELSSTYQDELEYEYSLDNTEYELKNKNKLEITKISSIHHDELKDEYSLDNTEQELKHDNNLEIPEISSKREELEDDYSLNNREHSSNEDHVMLANVLETTRLSPIHQDEQNYDCNFLTSPELSLNNDKSISSIDSPNIKFHYDYDEVQDIDGCCNTCSSEYTESFPSPIFYNDSLIDDIRYVEDYNDISFFDPSLSDDAMNEAFVED
ncbi:uncharacterized protein LOC132940726 [Metopolophium dirhodum]|uniref:uncharacterized protein LOC132940726 n=1 Tax=Metopolophium dirhodum TaxID=44670 RepID=UPI00298F4B34|nr:uncharacterized protein LOC132940726 [Metopolophium dirhodum]